MYRLASAAAAEHGGEAVHHGIGVVPHHYKIPLGDSAFASFHLDTVLSTWLVMAVLIIVSLIVSRSLKKSPDATQTIAEGLIEFIEDLVGSQIVKGKGALKYVPLIGTIFLFVLVGNWFGLIPWRLLHLVGVPVEIASPTNDLNTTGGLAIISLMAYLYYGISKKGLSYFSHYVNPHPLFFPLNFMEDFTRPLSLAFRLFGNIIGGEIVIAVLLLLAPWFIPLPLFMFEVFVGFIQAFIFAILTASYIGAAVVEHH